MKWRTPLLAFGVLVSGGNAEAQEIHELRENLPLSAGVVVVGATVVISTEIAKQDIAPSTCHWCDRDRDERDTLNPIDRGVRNALKWEDSKLAARLSDILGFLVVPAGAATTLGVAAANDQAERKVGNDFAIVLESMAISGVLNQAVKFGIARERPNAHYREIGDVPVGMQVSRDEHLSFYSGHTAQTFTIAAATSTVAFLRGYELAPLLPLVTAPIAAFTGYLRIAADKHYFTDVLAGAIVGTAIGILVPLTLHPRKGDEIVAPESARTPPTPTQVFSFGGAF